MSENNNPTYWVSIQSFTASDWDTLKTQIQETLSSDNDHFESDVFLYRESLSECSLTPLTWSEIQLTQSDWQGRVFNQDLDLRWHVDASNSSTPWRAWLTREYENESQQDGKLENLITQQVTRCETKYYLHGIYSAIESEGAYFYEARFPGKTFKYPVDMSAPAKDSRAYVMAYEYHRVMPDFSKLSADQIEQQLNQPLLWAHRLFGLGVGSDDEPKKQKQQKQVEV